MNTVSPGLLGSPGIPWDLLAGLRKGIFPPSFPRFLLSEGKPGYDETLDFHPQQGGEGRVFPDHEFCLDCFIPCSSHTRFPQHRSNKEPLHAGAMENRGWDIPPSTPRKVIPKKHFRSSGSWRSWGAGETPRNPGFSANPAFSAAGNWGREEQAAPGAAHPYGVFPLLVMDFSQLFPLLNIPFLPTL